ncbi:hypothetical protein GCM10022240_27550 [Microbacterium kribbense]|uniref:HTH tetR-type domain-containing protein n=1 Tax=Microbacterium kribbense TaxID=433645 RepID=A0ABP7GVC5_9MICO
MTDPEDPAGARTRILDAATTLFAAHGFDGTSTARIARVASVPKGLLFYYFPTKSDILSALLAEGLGVPAIDPTSLSVPGDPVRALINVGERILRNHAASGVLREIIWHESHTRPEVGAALTRYRQALHATIEQVLSASLTAHVGSAALRAAAAAWGATITARPLDSGRPDAPPGGYLLHSAESLRSIAELLCAGLVAPHISTLS